jgi:hypothetical protein
MRTSRVVNPFKWFLVLLIRRYEEGSDDHYFMEERSPAQRGCPLTRRLANQHSVCHRGGARTCSRLTGRERRRTGMRGSSKMCMRVKLTKIMWLDSDQEASEEVS